MIPGFGPQNAARNLGLICQLPERVCQAHNQAQPNSFDKRFSALLVQGGSLEELVAATHIAGAISSGLTKPSTVEPKVLNDRDLSSLDRDRFVIIYPPTVITRRGVGWGNRTLPFRAGVSGGRHHDHTLIDGFPPRLD